MGNTLLTNHFGLLNEHCAGCKIMDQKRRDDMNESNVTSGFSYFGMFLLMLHLIII